MSFMKVFFGNYSKKELKRIQPICDKVEALESTYQKMSDDELRHQTDILKARLKDGETIDDILPDAFAVCREASFRVLNMKHFRVQIIGGIVLHQGRIAEMKTGEGKTLVATLPAYLNGLTGNGVHIVTVNEYLARRDSEWMGKVYKFLGLTVGLIYHDQPNSDRQAAYGADITYCTNNELGFDYLRDNMVVYKEQRVQRGHVFAIVDEVDSILIDEARTPLIISGKGDKSTDLYAKANVFAASLRHHKFTEVDAKEDLEDFYAEHNIDYIIDEKAKSATLTQNGVKKAEDFFSIENLTDPENLTIQHHINQAIKAIGVMKKDVDYVVKDGEVLIVDEFTGRLMYGRRYNEGLHQAIEAKENVKIENESKTLATITFQNYFRLYNKLSGMTGTALTEDQEFREIYKLDVIEIPTNKPMIRHDRPDVIFRTERGKYATLIEEIAHCNEKGQPVLVGTVSIEKSELLSNFLKKRGIKHNVLNAKQHDKEAEIVAQAGKVGAVTIATNMAGRGTDIMLGGNAEYLAKTEMRKLKFPEELISEATGFGETEDPEILNARETFKNLHEKHKEAISLEAEKVREAGGLFIMGTERHESRRIDNQLRGRAGRQGDPGTSQFYLSTEDSLMRLFGGERMNSIMTRMNVEENMPIENKMLSNMIEGAQQRVEQRNFGIRKNVLEYDDVMNRQREIIYTQRNKVLDGENIHSTILKMMEETITDNVNLYLSDEEKDNWNLAGLREFYNEWLIKDINKYSFTARQLEDIEKNDIVDMLTKDALDIYKANEAILAEKDIQELERVILLKSVDTHWMDHIDDMEQLKQGIRLRSYGQRDPIVEYRLEGFDMFDHMIASIREETVRRMLITPGRIVEIQKRQEEQEEIARQMAGKIINITNQVNAIKNRRESGTLTLKSALTREQTAKPTHMSSDGTDTRNKTVINKNTKVGRNDPCPCGSGKKYKKCCGMNE